MALRKKKPHTGAQRGAQLLRVPCAVGGRTTSEPPGRTGTGLSRYRKARAARYDVQSAHFLVSCSHPPRRPTAPRSAENAAGLCPACFSVCACRCCPAPGCSALLSCKQGGTVERTKRAAVVSSADGPERGGKTKICPQICFEPKRREAARREQAQRDHSQGRDRTCSRWVEAPGGVSNPQHDHRFTPEPFQGWSVFFTPSKLDRRYYHVRRKQPVYV